jgi:transposase-like protein
MHQQQPSSEVVERPRPVRTPREDQERFVAAWRASGSTQVAFAREHGIPTHRLGYWIQQAQRRAVTVTRWATGEDDYFVECPVPQRSVSSRHTLCLGDDDNGSRIATLHLTSDVSPAFLAALVREVLR